jgi:hypothetical protein
MRELKVSAARRIAKVAAGTCLAVFFALGCSWDYPVWPKNTKSDTPLFRFVINERDGAGYIDRDGKVIIKPTLFVWGNFGDDDFFDGLAKVRTNGEDWYIDASGKRVFRVDFLSSGRFSEGLASSVKDGKAGFVNREGKLVIPRSFDSAEAFSEGLAVVGVNRLYGYINKDGSFAIEPKYVLALSFSEGAARVIEQGQCLYIGYGPCSGFIPTTLPYDSNTKQSSNAPRCRYSFIDRKGTRLFGNQYPDAKDFAEGLVPIGDGKLWGYINRRGTVVIPMRYEDAEPFAEGFARVRINGKWGYIDKSGKLAIPATFQSALDFSEGMAVVGDGVSRFWFIDKTGHQPFAQFYTAASSFVMGRAHAHWRGLLFREVVIHRSYRACGIHLLRQSNRTINRR